MMDKKQWAFVAVFQNNTRIEKLSGEATIVTPEMFAIETTLTKILNNCGEKGSYAIFSGSQSSLLFVKSWAGVSQ